MVNEDKIEETYSRVRQNSRGGQKEVGEILFPVNPWRILFSATLKTMEDGIKICTGIRRSN